MDGQPLHAADYATDQLGRWASGYHRDLMRRNHQRMQLAVATSDWEVELDAEARLRRMETGFVESERRAIAPWIHEVPTGAIDFLAWFEKLEECGPGQGDALFPWLAERADIDAMRWFIKQEAAGEAGFDDLVALSQLRLPPGPKLEMARNYWDEMGRGRLDDMHGPMLDRAVTELQVAPDLDETVWESLALANLMLALASSRRYAYQAIGALGVVELTAPGRATLVNAGLARLHVSPMGRRYFKLHAGLDVRHSEAWNREVLGPLVERDPHCAVAIAEGALMRLNAGARCFERYRNHFGISASRSKGAQIIERALGIAA